MRSFFLREVGLWDVSFLSPGSRYDTLFFMVHLKNRFYFDEFYEIKIRKVSFQIHPLVSKQFSLSTVLQ